MFHFVLASMLAGFSCGNAPHPLPPDATDARDLASRIVAAAPGDVVRVESGSYRGVITIDKPLTLEGIGRPVIEGFGRGDLILITAPDVTVRGFDIRATGTDLDKENCGIRVLAPRAVIEDNRLEDVLFGIDLRGAPDSVVRGNTVGGKSLDIARRGDGLRIWKSDRARIENNTLHDGRDAVLWYSTAVEVRGNRVERCRYGFHLMYSHQVRIEHNELLGNSVGLYIMYSEGVDVRDNLIARNRGPSGFGIGLKEVSDYRIGRNLIRENCVGMYIDDAPFRPGPAEICGNVISCNNTAMEVLPNAKGNVIADNAFFDNLRTVTPLGRGDLYSNAFSRGEGGNYWSDYIGYDEDGDGIGEWVHEPVALFSELIEREPRLAVLRFSPAEQAIDFVARAIPAMRPGGGFVDEFPRTRLPTDATAALTAGRVGRASEEGFSAVRAALAAFALLVVSALAALGGMS